VATRAEDRSGVRGVSARAHGVDETKASFKTTEFIAYLAVSRVCSSPRRWMTRSTPVWPGFWLRRWVSATC